MMHLQKNEILEEDLIRHMVLNSIRLYNKKFSKEYGEMVIACDGPNYWRRDVFPFYKANRKKNRDASQLDWKLIFDSLNKIRDELKVYFPYRVIHLNKIEADDIIATIIIENCDTIINNQKYLILSSDKDFNQLQVYPNVEQYDPIRKKFIKVNDPNLFLKEHILKGDTGDGIPNFLSPDDCFVSNQRQKPISAKKLEKWMNEDPRVFCNEEQLRNYHRNATLIDFKQIPQNIRKDILLEYKKEEGKDRSRLFNYFIQNRLKNLMEVIGDF